MVNKCSFKGVSRKPSYSRHHERHGTTRRRQSHSEKSLQDDNGAEDHYLGEFRVPPRRRSSSTIEFFGYKYEIEHVEDAIEDYSSDEIDVSHKHFEDKKLPKKRANTRFRRHSTPSTAIIPEGEAQTQTQAGEVQVQPPPKVSIRYIPKRRASAGAAGAAAAAFESCSSGSESDSEQEVVDELEEQQDKHQQQQHFKSSSPTQQRHNHQHQHHHKRSTLTRRQRRKLQLEKKLKQTTFSEPVQAKDPQTIIKEIYADDSDSSIDLTELNEIEKQHFEHKRRQELEQLTREWEQKMKILGGRIPMTSVFLPPEILDLIFDCMGPEEFSVQILYVCKSWYSVGIEHLYKQPLLTAKNYSKFVEALGNKSNLGFLVKHLDLRNIIQAGKPSSLAKVLRRCNASLQVFIAPQTSFGYAPLIALKNCKKLKDLDLSLVSETVDLRILFSAIANATELERLDFPRSSVFCQDYDGITWPANIWNLGLSGGISNEFLKATRFPSTITHLTISHCPFVNSDSVRSLATRLGSHLQSLRVLYPLPALRPNTFDTVFRLCPKLRSLTVSVDYISRYMFAKPNLPQDEFGTIIPHPLKYLTLDSSGSLGQARKIDADDISLAILDDKLPNLSHVRVHSKLGWNPNAEEMSELAEILDENDGGVWIFNGVD